MPTLTVPPERLVEVCTHLRDRQGANLLSAVSAVDHLGFGEPVAGYFGTERGRDINATGSWGAPETVAAPPARFKIVYHLARIPLDATESPQRIRVQV